MYTSVLVCVLLGVALFAAPSAAADAISIKLGQTQLIEEFTDSQDYKLSANLDDLQNLLVSAQCFTENPTGLSILFGVDQGADKKPIWVDDTRVPFTREQGTVVAYGGDLIGRLKSDSLCGAKTSCDLVVRISYSLYDARYDKGLLGSFVVLPQPKGEQQLTSPVGALYLTADSSKLMSYSYAYEKGTAFQGDSWPIIAFNFIVEMKNGDEQSYAFVKQYTADGTLFEIRAQKQDMPFDDAKIPTGGWQWPDLKDDERRQFWTSGKARPLGTAMPITKCTDDKCYYAVTVFAGIDEKRVVSNSIFFSIVKRSDFQKVTPNAAALKTSTTPVGNNLFKFFEIDLTNNESSFAHLKVFTESTSVESQYFVLQRSEDGQAVTNLGIFESDEFALLGPQKAVFDVFYFGDQKKAYNAKVLFDAKSVSDVQVQPKGRVYSLQHEQSENVFATYRIEQPDLIAVNFKISQIQGIGAKENIVLQFAPCPNKTTQCKFPTSRNRVHETDVAHASVGNGYRIVASDPYVKCGTGCTWMVRVLPMPGTLPRATEWKFMLSVKLEVPPEKPVDVLHPEIFRDQDIHELDRFPQNAISLTAQFQVDLFDKNSIVISAHNRANQPLAFLLLYPETNGTYTPLYKDAINVLPNVQRSAEPLFNESVFNDLRKAGLCKQTACIIHLKVYRDPQYQSQEWFKPFAAQVTTSSIQTGQVVQREFGPIIVKKSSGKYQPINQAYLVTGSSPVSNADTNGIQAYRYILTAPATASSNMVVVREFGTSDTYFLIKTSLYACTYGVSGCSNFRAMDLKADEASKFSDPQGIATKVGHTVLLQNCTLAQGECTYDITVFVQSKAVSVQNSSFYLQVQDLASAQGIEADKPLNVSLNPRKDKVFELFSVAPIAGQKTQMLQVTSFYYYDGEGRLPEAAQYLVFSVNKTIGRIITHSLHHDDQLAVQNPNSLSYYILFLGSGDTDLPAKLSYTVRGLTEKDFKSGDKQQFDFELGQHENLYSRYRITSTRTKTVTLKVALSDPLWKDVTYLRYSTCPSNLHRCTFPSSDTAKNGSKVADLVNGEMQFNLQDLQCGNGCVLLFGLEADYPQQITKDSSKYSATVTLNADYEELPKKEDSGIPGWAIVLIIIGSLLVGGALFFYGFRAYRRKQKVDSNEYGNDNYGRMDEEQSYQDSVNSNKKVQNSRLKDDNHLQE